MYIQKFNFLIKNYPVNQIRDKGHKLYKKFLVKIQKIRKEKLVLNKKYFSYYFPLNKKFYNFFLEKTSVNKKLNVLSKIIEDLKNLYIFPDNEKMVIKIKEIKDRWEHSSNIFYSKVEDVFKTYRFHLENFFNYLKFNKNFQSLELQKLHIISRVEELINITKLTKNLNELYHLHHLLNKNARKKKEYLLKYAFFTSNYFKFLERKFFRIQKKIYKIIKKEQGVYKNN
jgi:hypothetical protein